MAKVLLSVDDVLLRRIDSAARAGGLTRSVYIARLAERELTRASGPELTAARRALERLDRLFDAAAPADATDEMRAERDAR